MPDLTFSFDLNSLKASYIIKVIFIYDWWHYYYLPFCMIFFFFSFSTSNLALRGFFHQVIWAHSTFHKIFAMPIKANWNNRILCFNFYFLNVGLQFWWYRHQHLNNNWDKIDLNVPHPCNIILWLMYFLSVSMILTLMRWSLGTAISMSKHFLVFIVIAIDVLFGVLKGMVCLHAEIPQELNLAIFDCLLWLGASILPP